jgi:hypothetical protein
MWRRYRSGLQRRAAPAAIHAGVDGPFRCSKDSAMTPCAMLLHNEHSARYECVPNQAPQPEPARRRILDSSHRTTHGEPEMPGAAHRLAAVVSRRDAQWLPERVDTFLDLRQVLSSVRDLDREQLLRAPGHLPGGNAPAAVRLALEPCSAWRASPESAPSGLSCGRPRGMPCQPVAAPRLDGRGTPAARLPPTPGRPERTEWPSIAAVKVATLDIAAPGAPDAHGYRASSWTPYSIYSSCCLACLSRPCCASPGVPGTERQSKGSRHGV